MAVINCDFIQFGDEPEEGREGREGKDERNLNIDVSKFGVTRSFASHFKNIYMYVMTAAQRKLECVQNKIMIIGQKGRKEGGSR